MLTTISITSERLFILFAFVFIGFFFQKKRIVSEALSGQLSKLVLYIFLPCLSFNNFVKNFKVDNFKSNLTLILTGFAIIISTLVISIFLSKLFSQDYFVRKVFLYSFTVPNFGFLGYPLTEGVFGEDALFNAMLFAIPYNLFIYSYGLAMFDPNCKSIWKKLINPGMIALLLGIVVGLMDIKLPAVITNTTKMAEGCMAPCAMILMGLVLGKKPFFSMLNSAKMWLASFIRLVAIPGLCAVILFLLGVDNTIAFTASVFLAMPLGLNTIVYAEAFGSDSAPGAQACLISNIMGLITIPIVFSVLEAVFK